jgi:CRISPR-associated protein Cas1
MSPLKDLHELPKFRDSLSYLYVERAILNRKRNAVEFVNEQGRVMIPVASLSVLLLGPGTNISHAAVKVLADNGCSVIWVGEDSTRFYARGTGETRKAYHLLKQAELASDPEKRKDVVLAMYHKRFAGRLDPSLTLPQIRGHEGVRVREAYAAASQKLGVEWSGRRYDRSDWRNADPINRALSAANALLNGICHAAIVSGGYSPAIGFIHTGKQLSFVYDIADLYKVDITIPTAFATVAESNEQVEARVRQACRERFRETRLLRRILPDIDELLGAPIRWPVDLADVDEDSGLPTQLWKQLFTDGEPS